MNHYLVGEIAYPASNLLAVEHGRPVVVIDPEDREQVERLAAALFHSGWVGERWDSLSPAGKSAWKSRTKAALREFANPTPPKPDEPTGLGAVVEDEDGTRWVAIGLFKRPDAIRWRQEFGVAYGARAKFSDIPGVRVLSEGVRA